MDASPGSSPGSPAGGEPAESKWWVILHGIVAILFGLVTLAWPAITLVGLALVFGFFAVAAGVIAILMGLRAEGEGHRWLYLAAGVVAALAGITALAWSAITPTALLYLIAAWAIVTGVIEIAGTFRPHLAGVPDWLLTAGGTVSIIFGILLLVWPRLGVLALVWLIGIFAIVYGILHLVLAFTAGAAKHSAAT